MKKKKLEEKLTKTKKKLAKAEAKVAELESKIAKGDKAKPVPTPAPRKPVGGGVKKTVAAAPKAKAKPGVRPVKPTTGRKAPAKKIQPHIDIPESVSVVPASPSAVETDGAEVKAAS